jgi:hypothetical protein
LAEAAVSAVAEMLAPFRGTGDLHPDLLVRSGRQLAVAELELTDDATLIDFDEPTVLVKESLRPSTVATNQRSVTQAYAVAQFERHSTATGLRWWSTLEASWIQVTLFDRAIGKLHAHSMRALSVDDATVIWAATHLGLA